MIRITPDHYDHLHEAIFPHSPHHIISDWGTEDFQKPSATKTAAWIKQGSITDRRDEIRHQLLMPVQVQPLNAQLGPTGSPQMGKLVNYSMSGACLEHEQVIPETHVKISWTDDKERAHDVLIKLKWCRCLSENQFRSGGCVLGMD